MLLEQFRIERQLFTEAARAATVGKCSRCHGTRVLPSNPLTACSCQLEFLWRAQLISSGIPQRVWDTTYGQLLSLAFSIPARNLLWVAQLAGEYLDDLEGLLPEGLTVTCFCSEGAFETEQQSIREAELTEGFWLMVAKKAIQHQYNVVRHSLARLVSAFNTPGQVDADDMAFLQREALTTDLYLLIQDAAFYESQSTRGTYGLSQVSQMLTTRHEAGKTTFVVFPFSRVWVMKRWGRFLAPWFKGAAVTVDIDGN